jgi:uncharacterized repeat protein (TIGR01451 family)
MTVNQGSTTTRNFPDVALTADNVYVIADGGFGYRGVGGTSCAAPLWAGFTALVNQQAANASHAPVGFINPAIYAIAQGANYANCFHDITTGNNTWSGSPTLFFAVPGYDLCTGLGTPNGINLINALVTAGGSSFTHISPPPPPYGTTLAVLNGGNPNGTWELFVQDNVNFDSGTNYNGWILTLTTASPVGEAGDLEVSMTSSITNVLVGSDFDYVIGVTNHGPSTSSNVVVSDTLPLNFTLITNNQPDSVTHNGFNLIWNVGTLANGAGAQLTLTVQPNSPGTNILNFAIVNSTTPDPNPAEDVASVSVNVSAAQPPQIGNIMISNGKFILSITNPAVSTIIQATTNLTSANWIPIYTNMPPFSFTDLNTSVYPYRFYRALFGQ